MGSGEYSISSVNRMCPRTTRVLDAPTLPHSRTEVKTRRVRARTLHIACGPDPALAYKACVAVVAQFISEPEKPARAPSSATRHQTMDVSSAPASASRAATAIIAPIEQHIVQTGGS